MADRDWDKELAKIDKQLASISDEALVAKPAAPAAQTGKAPGEAGKASAPLRAPVAALVTSYGGLKLLPFWDPLRGDPRFEKIVASLAPKQ